MTTLLQKAPYLTQSPFEAGRVRKLVQRLAVKRSSQARIVSAQGVCPAVELSEGVAYGSAVSLDVHHSRSSAVNRDGGDLVGSFVPECQWGDEFTVVGEELAPTISGRPWLGR